MSALITYRHNMRSVERELDSREVATRIFTRGGAQGDYHLTMADHRWEVVAIDGATVTLGPDAGGNPIRFAGQLDRLWARKYPTSAQWLVLSSDPATQDILLDAVPDTLEVGDFLQFRVGSTCLGQAGSQLTYLDRPSTMTTYGIWEGVLRREDIPPIDNLVPNAWTEEWYEAFPDEFWPVGWESTPTAAVITKSAAAAFRQFGHYSAYVEAYYAGGFMPGIQTEWIPVHPTAERPYFSFAASFWIQQGTVRMEIDVDLAGDGTQVVTIPDPGLTVVEETSGKSGVRSNVFRKLNVWTYAGIGGLNLWDDPAIGAGKRVRLRLMRETDQLTAFYLDAGQITNDPSVFDSWYDRLASNALWHATLDELERVGELLARHRVLPLDLFREDPVAYEALRLERGFRVTMRDTDLGMDVASRIASVDRVLTEDQQVVTEVELENKRRVITGQVNRTERPRTTVDVRDAKGGNVPPTPGGALSGLRLSLLINPDGDGQDYELVEWDHNQVVEDEGTPRFTVDVASTLAGSLVTGRDPRIESLGTNLTPRVGSYRRAVDVSSGGGDWYTNVYTVSFHDAGGTTQTYQTSRSGYYVAW